jgi:hypothetical protein
LFLVTEAVALAQLVAGDLAIVAFNSDAPEAFAWVALREVPPATVLNFTDSSTSNGCFLWSEHLQAGPAGEGQGGPLSWTWTQPLAAGRVVRFSGASGKWNVGTASQNPPVLGANGDQLFVYTGTIAHNPALPGGYEGAAGAATFLYGVNFGNAGWANAAGTDRSAVPPGLSGAAQTAVHVTTRDNGYYAGMTTGTVAQLRAALATAANWVTSDSALPSNRWPTAFVVLPDTTLFEFAGTASPWLAAAPASRRWEGQE